MPFHGCYTVINPPFCLLPLRVTHTVFQSYTLWSVRTNCLQSWLLWCTVWSIPCQLYRITTFSTVYLALYRSLMERIFFPCWRWHEKVRNQRARKTEIRDQRFGFRRASTVQLTYNRICKTESSSTSVVSNNRCSRKVKQNPLRSNHVSTNQTTRTNQSSRDDGRSRNTE